MKKLYYFFFSLCLAMLGFTSVNAQTTSMSAFSNYKCYKLDNPRSSWIATTAGLQTLYETGIADEATDPNQQFAFLTRDGGETNYLYSVGQKKFITREGLYSESAEDPIYCKSGLYSNSLVFYFDDTHYINVCSDKTMIIDNWRTVDDGNSNWCYEAADFDPIEALQAIPGIGDISVTKNHILYTVEQLNHSKGATAWAVQDGKLVSTYQVDNLTNSMTEFAFITYEGTTYIYHPAEAMFVNKDGLLGKDPIDPITFINGNWNGTFIVKFDDAHYVNVGGSRRIEINNWHTADGGNSNTFSVVGEYDPTEALNTIKNFKKGSSDITSTFSPNTPYLLSSDNQRSNFLTYNGKSNLVSAEEVNADAFIEFEPANEQSAEGYELYYLKFSSTGLYIADQEMPDGKDSWDNFFEGIEYYENGGPYFTLTASKEVAAKWTILPAQTCVKANKGDVNYIENWRTYTSQGSNNVPYNNALIIMRNELSTPNGDNPVYLEKQSYYTIFAPWAAENSWFINEPQIATIVKSAQPACGKVVSTPQQVTLTFNNEIKSVNFCQIQSEATSTMGGYNLSEGEYEINGKTVTLYFPEAYASNQPELLVVLSVTDVYDNPVTYSAHPQYNDEGIIFLHYVYSEFEQLTNIPTIYINTYGSQPITSKTTYIYADMVYVSETDTVTYDSLKIRGRGNSTWGLAKKPYRIKFNESTKFLGKGFAKNKSWTLLANHGDKSLLRNAVTSRMGDFLGMPFNPAAHFVDLVINGTYLGNYQVSDQVNVDNKRVEIFEQEDVATEESNITGGYLMEIDGFAYGEPVYVRTNKGLSVTIKSPDEECINTAQKTYIRDYLNSFESALFNVDFTDTVSGYRAMLDSTTTVAWYIASELSANPDCFWSTYIYKDQDDPKIYFGPLWDYDIAYNNCNRIGDVTNRSMSDVAFASNLTEVWARQFLKDPWFNKAVNDAWKQKISDGLTDYLCHYIDSMATHIDASQQLNYNRYSISTKTYNEIYLYSTYDDYITQLKTFIREHADFLTTLFQSRVSDDSGDDSGDDDGDSGEEGDDIPVELEPFKVDNSYYYRIFNKKNHLVFDVDDAGHIVMWNALPDRNEQLWKIEQVGNYYCFINKGTGLALNDPSEVKGANLNLAVKDVTDERQLWDIVVVNENGNYNMINVATQWAVNNSGGTYEDGNPVISYTNDDRNSVSLNRQWNIHPDEPIADYVSDEVKAMLQETIAEAEAFLASLTVWTVGENPFQYSSVTIQQLRTAVADAKSFESTVADDYILQNVNLSNVLDAARTVNAPSTTKRYVLKHRATGLVLDIANGNPTIQQYETLNQDQYFAFSPATEGKFYIKSNSSNSLSFETDEFTITPMNGYYTIMTSSGYLATMSLEEGCLVNASHESLSDVYGEWLLEEVEVNELMLKSQELADLVATANTYIYNIPESWIGDAPLQHNLENMEALQDLATSLDAAVYATVAEYEAAINLLTTTIEQAKVLNQPSNGMLYNIRHASGKNLSTALGLTLELPNLADYEQMFVLIPVEGKFNAYNIYSNGMYLTVNSATEPLFTFSETPRDDHGCFVAAQVGENQFTLTSIAGLVGADNAIVVANAQNEGDNVMWSLLEVNNSTEIGSVAYDNQIDYAVRYDRERQVIGFVSYDLQKMATVNVQLHTIGGRLLYTFNATQEQSLTKLPSGTYIISWNWAGKTHSVKFVKQ